jgi:hypothetical protein
MGLANDKSIAWGIAEALHAEGAEIGVTYVGEAMKKRVLPLAEQLNAAIVAECDAGDPDSIAALMIEAKDTWGKIDFIVHAIGFSDKSELRGQYINTSRDNFLMTMDISAYSFTAILQAAQELLAPGASCLTMTYYGAEKVMPNYNVMGVAKAALEASVRYLAEDLGRHKYPSKRDLSRNNQNPRRLGHWRFPRDYEVERNQQPAAPHRDPSGSRQIGALFAVGPRVWCDGRNFACGCRLSRHRNEGSRAA